MNNRFLIATIVSIVCLLATGGATAPNSDPGGHWMCADATAVFEQSKQADLTLDTFLKISSGYAVFASVINGAAVAGGSSLDKIHRAAGL